MRLAKTMGGWLLAVLVATLGTGLVHSWRVQSGLRALGAEIPADVGLATAIGDIAGMGVPVAGVYAIALALGFGLARLLRPWLPGLAGMAYPLAGGLAVAATLAIMKTAMHITPLAGARDILGFLGFCLSGVLGGLVFQRLSLR